MKLRNILLGVLTASLISCASMTPLEYDGNLQMNIPLGKNGLEFYVSSNAKELDDIAISASDYYNSISFRKIGSSGETRIGVKIEY